MSLTVERALQITVFEKCRLLTGKAGLDNEIYWVNILEILDDLSHIEPGEFLITTAHGFNVDSEAEQKVMAKLFAQKKLGAMAIQTGHYLKKIPLSFIRFLEELSIPLIEIPPEVSFKNLTRALLNELMIDRLEKLPEDVISEKKVTPDRIDTLVESMKKLWQQIIEHDNPEIFQFNTERLGINPNEQIMVMLLTVCRNDSPGKSTSADLNDQLMKLAERKTAYSLKQNNIPFLIGPADNALLLLVQPGIQKDKPADELKIAEILYRELKNLAPECEIRFGLSNLHNSYNELKQAQAEAEKAQQAAQLELLDYTNMVSFRAMNLYRLIMDIDNMDMLKGIYLETVSPLLQYDQRCGGGLLKTLKIYLQLCSLKKASEALFVHRHTLRYRLKQIEELTGFNPLLPNDALQLNIGLHIYYYLKALNLLS